jgi:hypothetical protein
MREARLSRKKGSTTIGLLTFLVGVAMIGFAFYLAYQIFTVPPHVRMNAVLGSAIDIGSTVEVLVKIIIQILLLVAMAGFGSMVANRGIKLYANANKRDRPEKQEESNNSQQT